MLNNQDYFEQKTTQLGNRYAAVNYIAHKARTLEESFDNKILSSEALSWVMTGQEPKILSTLKDIDKKKLSDEIRTMEEYLIYIDDMDVRYATQDSIEESINKKHITYLYNNIEDEPRKARVRVLSNMIWQNIYLLKKEGINPYGRRI